MKFRLRLLLAAVMLVTGVSAALAPNAFAGGRGVCYTSAIREVSGTGSSAHPCKVDVPHAKYQLTVREAHLQGDKFRRLYSSDRSYSLMFGVSNGVANYWEKAPLAHDDSYTSVYGRIPVVVGVDRSFKSYRMDYLHITVVVVYSSGGKQHSEQYRLLCGTGQSYACPTNGYRNIRRYNNWQHIGGSMFHASSKCWTTRAYISWASAWINGRYITDKGHAHLSTAWWKVCDSM